MPGRTATVSSSQGPIPLPKRKAWKALRTHYKKVRDLHLRNFFADDPQRGERMTAEAAGLFLDYSKNRATDETIKLLLRLAEESGLQSRIDAMFRGRKSTSPSSGRSCTWPCALTKDHPSWSMVRTLYPRSTLCSTRWLTSPTAYGTGSGRGTPASAFATLSISASAAPTLGRSWHTRR